MPRPLSQRVLALAGAAVLALTLAAPATAQGDPAAVPYIDDAGTELGTILIRDFADPFTEYLESSPPGEGLRYALLTLTFEAAEDQAFATDPYQVQLLDTNGYLYVTQWVPRPPESAVDLQSQTLSPFDRVSGVISYVLPADAEVARIVYRANGRLMPIDDLAITGSVALGEPRPVVDAASGSSGSVTVRSIEDPFLGFDPNGPPAAGMRYVMLDTAFEAAEDQPLQARPGSVALVASDGRLFWPGWLPRPAPLVLQNLEQQPLSPGDRVSGAIGYLVPEGVTLDSVVYNPDSNRFLSVVDLRETSPGT